MKAILILVLLVASSAAVAQGCRNMTCTTASGITTCVCF
jgi:hypothetical protein